MVKTAVITGIFEVCSLAVKVAVIYAFIAGGLSLYKVTLGDCGTQLKVERIVKHGNLLCKESTFGR